MVGVKEPAEGVPPDSACYDAKQSLQFILTKMGVPTGRPVLIVAGAAATKLDEDVEDRQRLVLETVIAPICRECEGDEVVIVSGGTDAGIMAMLGTSMAELAPRCVLLGVAPHKKLRGHGAAEDDDDAAAPEEHHRLICTAGDDWGCEGPTLVRVADRVASGRSIVMIAVGGGRGTRREVTLAARRGWPIILVTGCNGESERLAVGLEEASSGATGHKIPDDVVAADRVGLITTIPVEERWQMERALRWQLGQDHILREAWCRFAAADTTAVTLKRPTGWTSLAVLVLATATVLGTVLLGVSRDPPTYARFLAEPWVRTLLRLLITTLPLLVATLIGLSDRRARQGTWIEMRAAAEATLRELYLFRARSGRYSKDPAVALNDALSKIDTQLDGRASVIEHHASGQQWWPPTGLRVRIPNRDSLLGPLDGLLYDEVRVRDQLAFMETSARSTERRATFLAATIFVLASATAVLLAISWRSDWRHIAAYAAIAAIFVAALVSWREYHQLDARADLVRSTAAAVRAARGRWQSTPRDEGNDSTELASYAEEVEGALSAEGSDWARALRQAQRGFHERHRGR